MVINREFFFRGWLPAGLVINARLLVSPSSDGTPVLRPVINPVPGRSWDANQPKPSFPVDQATETQAIILTSDFQEGALVMLPLGQWYGKGSPFILAANTWYEGKIQTVSGDDVMAVRLVANQRRDYFSSSEEAAKEGGQPDITATALVAHYIPGSNTRQALFSDDGRITMSYEKGFPTSAFMDGVSMAARVMDFFDLTPLQVAGLRGAYAKENPSTELRFIQCDLVNGNPPTSSGKQFDYFGIFPMATWVSQAFYLVEHFSIAGTLESKNLLDPDSEPTLAVVSMGKVGDQITFMN